MWASVDGRRRPRRRREPAGGWSPAWVGRHVGCHQERDLGAHKRDRVTALCRQPLDGAHVLLPRGRSEHAVHQLGKDDVVDDVAVTRFWYYGGYPAGGERPRIDPAFREVLGAEHADAPVAIARGEIGR